jgi:hypothetical protein
VGRTLLRSIVIRSIAASLVAGVSGMLLPAPLAAGQATSADAPKFYIDNKWAEPAAQTPARTPYVRPGAQPDGTPIPPPKPWGHPNIEGIYASKPAGVGLNSAFQTQPLPFTPAGLKAFNDVWSYIDPTSKCIIPGVPRLMNSGGAPIQFVQTPEKIVILYEYMHNFRVIWLDRRHPKDFLPTFLGHSVGRWEGDTLVVDTVGLRGNTNIDDHANVVSDALHVVEKYRRVSANQLSYEATIDDPKYYTRPWTASWLMPAVDPTWEVGEYACTDFNYSMESGNQQPGPLDGSLRNGGPIGIVPPGAGRGAGGGQPPAGGQPPVGGR